MKENPDSTDTKKDPEAAIKPENEIVPENPPEGGIKKEPQIPVAQIPMDGICGGY